MNIVRRGEDPYEFVAETLSLSEAEFAEAQKHPGILEILGRTAMNIINLAKELELERARTGVLKERAEQAETDQVTGLLLRGPFLRAAAELKPAAGYLAVIMDIRGLKAINDQIDHQAGDRMLVGTAQTLVQKGVRTGSLVGRWGGDEFAMVVPIDEESDSEVVMDRLQALFDGSETAETCEVAQDTTVYLSARFGHCAVKDTPPQAIDQALKKADELMQTQAREEATRGVMPRLVQ